MQSRYKVVDLFFFFLGLSLGFIQTGKYDVKVAFENNPDMQETYRYNHPNVEVLGDVCQADYADIQKKYGNIDVVIGGPPCQGFSNANRQKNHVISKNNMLVKQYLRAILELQPKAFVMENVSMLRSEVHRFYMEKGDESIINEYNIPVKETTIILLDSRYKFDSAIDIVKNEPEIRKYIWDDEDYFELNIIFKNSKNASKMQKALEKHKKRLLHIAEKQLHSKKNNDYISSEARRAFDAVVSYYNGGLALEDVQGKIEPSIMIQRMLKKAQEIFENNILVDNYSNNSDLVAKIKSFAVYDYIKGILSSKVNDYIINSGVICAADYGVPQKRMRFVILGVKRNISTKIDLPKGHFAEDQYRTVRDAISDLETIKPVYDLKDDCGIQLPSMKNLSDLAASLRNSNILKNHIITKTTDVAMERFKAIKQGQNFHSLDESLKINTYTDIARTQNTIYLRLEYNEPSGTVVNVRKSMWIHPILDRAISVREAARLQTFPDSFVFCGSKDKQYQQVGNAVPPIMARAIADSLARILDNTGEN